MSSTVPALGESDAVGNTTKAITKGIAIATAVLAATALYGSYSDAVNEAIAKAGASVSDFSYEVINPLLKVMNLVALLIAPAVVSLSYGAGANPVMRWAIALAAFAIAAFAVIRAWKRYVAQVVRVRRSAS